MRFTTPDYNIAEVNHCHGTGSKGHPCDGGSATSPRRTKAEQKILDRIDRDGQYAVNYGVLHRKKYGTRELNAASKLVKAGIIERIGGEGGTPIQSRASWMNNARLGLASYALYRRVKTWTAETAKRYMAEIQPHVERAGYRMELIGSVATKGTSAHDLDIKLHPVRADFNFEALMPKLGGDGQFTHDGDTEIYEVRRKDGRVIDFWFGEEPS